VCYTEKKFQKSGGEHAIAWRFGNEGLVKTKLFNYICTNKKKVFSPQVTGFRATLL
jgi:hypothetical protein